MTRRILNTTFYYYLVPNNNNNDNKRKCLFEDYPRHSLFNKFLVCWDYYDEKYKKDLRLYTVFPSHLDFAIFFLKVPEEQRSFYEIVLGEYLQKPHFDIDIEQSKQLRQQEEQQSDQEILDNLVTAIISLIPDVDLSKDVCLYSSHGKNKKSYHLVINHFCHPNNNEAKAFYYKIMEKLPKEYQDNKWIDHAVYSKTQQFRIYNSYKRGTNRIKILEKEWYFKGEKIIHQSDELTEDKEDENVQFLINLEESIVQARSSNCVLLPKFEEAEDEEVRIRSKFKSEEIDHDMAIEALNLLAKTGGITPEDRRFPYRLDKVEGPFVVLKRIKPSRCRLCNRIHEHQNPYLFVSPELNVFFHCRRAPPNRNLYIGSLKPEEEVKEENKIVVNWNMDKIREIASSSLNDSKKTKKKEISSYHRNQIVSNIQKKLVN